MWGGIGEWYGFCPSSLPLSTGISSSFSGENRGEVMVNCGGIVGKVWLQ
jgi:hypothetical protein